MSPTQPVKKYYFSVLGQRLNVNRFQPKLNILPFHRLQFRFHHGQLRLQLRVRVPCFFRLCLSLRGLLDLSCCCSPQKTATHAGFKRPVDWNPDQNGLGNARRGIGWAWRQGTPGNVSGLGQQRPGVQIAPER